MTIPAKGGPCFDNGLESGIQLKRRDISLLSDQPPKACHTAECLPKCIGASSPRYKGCPKKNKNKSVMSCPSRKELSTAFCVAKGQGDPNFARLPKEGAEG